MNAAPGKHPAREILQAFGLGKLDDASLTQVSQHLETCVDCKRQVAELSGDSLLGKLRQANSPAGTPAPGQPLAPLASAKVLPPSSVPPELRNNPQYDILRELGAGGMGVVYLAKNKLMDRLEVLKVISTAMVHKAGALDRFLREIRAAAALSHDNVVKAYSAMQFGETLVFAMEYVEGEDLAKVVKTQGPLPIANACYYARQAALGLQHAHDKNMVHRDIKPHNLILARVGKKHMVKILDFGLAKASSEKKLDRNLTGEGAMLGTPDYMAPEQSLDASTADIRADIYSLGCTLYYLLTGAPPFDAANLVGLLLAHQSTQARTLNLLRPEVPVELAAVVAKMMAKDPAKRYQKPVEVAQAMTPFFTKPGAQGPGRSQAIAVAKGVQAPPRRPEVATKRSETVGAASPATLVPRDKSVGDPFTFAPVSIVPNPIPTKARAKVAKRFKPLLVMGLAVGAVFLGLLLWAGGVFRVQTKDGVLVVQVNEPNADVFVDGEKVTVTWGPDGKQAEVRVKPGTRQVSVKKDGFSAHGETVTLVDGGRQVIVARLQRTPSTDGFVPLFNGKDLTGWKTHPSQPGNWRVVDGVVTGTGPDVSYLYTERGDYADFQLRAEARINEAGHSAVVFRTPFGPTYPTTTPQWLPGYGAEINSTQWDLVKTGSLNVYPDGTGARVPEAAAAAGKWFPLEIIAEGNHLIVKVNGKITAEFTDEKRLYSKGHIALQQHDDQTLAEFRKIEIKEIQRGVPPQTRPGGGKSAERNPAQRKPAKGSTDGFVPLFNGIDTTGWKTHPSQPGNWRVVNGVLTGSGPEVSHLYTERGDYSDFHLRAEARINDNGRSAVVFRAPYGGYYPTTNRRWSLGYEAVINSTNWDLKTGGLYGYPDGTLASVRESAAAAGEWFTLDIIAEGNHLVSKVNGRTTAVYTDENRRYGNGHIALQQHDDLTLAEFRKIEIKELP